MKCRSHSNCTVEAEGTQCPVCMEIYRYRQYYAKLVEDKKNLEGQVSTLMSNVSTGDYVDIMIRRVARIMSSEGFCTGVAIVIGLGCTSLFASIIVLFLRAVF